MQGILASDALVSIVNAAARSLAILPKEHGPGGCPSPGMGCTMLDASR